MAVSGYFPFFWLSLMTVLATPLAFVSAVVVWLPSWKTIVRRASGLPVASTSVALTVTDLFGPPLRAPVYVVVLALRAMVMFPDPELPIYRRRV